MFTRVALLRKGDEPEPQPEGKRDFQYAHAVVEYVANELIDTYGLDDVLWTIRGVPLSYVISYRCPICNNKAEILLPYREWLKDLSKESVDEKLNMAIWVTGNTNVCGHTTSMVHTHKKIEALKLRPRKLRF